MTLHDILQRGVSRALTELFSAEVTPADVQVQPTRKDFAGDATVVVFPLLRHTKLGPEPSGEALGDWLVGHVDEVKGFNVVKGFLNVEATDGFWLDAFAAMRAAGICYGRGAETGRTIVLEYCGPNTNKPLHLGHVRNMLIGSSTARLLQWAGHDVHPVNIYNDRGIQICKSMLGWLRFGDGQTPSEAGEKGDHFVVRFYIAFEQAYREQVEALVADGMDRDEAKREAPLMREAREMLVAWEAGDPETVALWERMNSWVYAGFDQTYRALGVSFERDYKESDHYRDGKKMVEAGLAEGRFQRRDDGSIWADLTDDGLDEKLLLRGDGTSVYLTQDMAIARARYQDYAFDESIYVVGKEQDYHFQVLKLVLEKLGEDYADRIHHMWYGMVDLPDGRMKSREGNVVDADDLIAAMIDEARQNAEELGRIDDLDEVERAELHRRVGLAALKYHILKVDPRKRVVFDPKESIDFQGHTGPFIQYTYVRTRSVLRKTEDDRPGFDSSGYALHPAEAAVVQHCATFPDVVQDAASAYDVSRIAAFAYELARRYNVFWTQCPVLTADDDNAVAFRLELSALTGDVLRSAMEVLGIEMPERM